MFAQIFGLFDILKYFTISRVAETHIRDTAMMYKLISKFGLSKYGISKDESKWLSFRCIQ